MSYTNSLDNPELYFQTKLYTGNGSSRSITLDGSENMQPDWVWIKNRGGTYASPGFDSVRGTTKFLETNENTAEQTDSNTLTSFDSNGFSLGSDGNSYVNRSSSPNTYVAWNWKAGGSASSNSDGSITSSVSANQTAGFSIVSYTGNGSATQTIGHGLGAVPKMIIFKRRNSSSDWIVYHNKPGATKYLSLNLNGAASAYEPYFANTEPTSSVFTVDTAGDINGSSDTFIAYCFAEKKGYSKFGSYTGNGNADGPFCFTGFRPSFILGKRTDSAGGWWLSDNKRSSGFNLNDEYLIADSSNAEQDDGSFASDFLSNGWKARATNGNFNASGGSYIYMAFAESPFVNSNSIPNNAR
jgi:hypothetical protein